jgi:hypothetical protein
VAGSSINEQVSVVHVVDYLLYAVMAIVATLKIIGIAISLVLRVRRKNS